MSPNIDSLCSTETSLGMQLALHYLEKKGQKIAPEIYDESGVQLGRITLPILTSHWGSYQGLAQRLIKLCSVTVAPAIQLQI